MFIGKLKITAALLTALAIMGTGAGLLLHHALASSPQSSVERPQYRAIVLADDPTQLKADGPVLVKGNTAFACDLYARLRGEQDGNLFISPYSISSALGMTYAGARGQTAEQMAKVMHFTLPQERLHPAAGTLARDLSGGDKKRGYQLSVANALWGQKNYGFRDEFLTLNHTCYGAGLQEVDFINAREEARKTINAWVEKETKDKIKELLKPNRLTADSRLVLTNAIYFKAEWERKFYREGTREAPFQVTAQRKVNVPTMHLMANFPYLDGGTFGMLELPYKERDLSMLILLPKKVDGLAELEKSLTADKLAEWQAKLQGPRRWKCVPAVRRRGKRSSSTPTIRSCSWCATTVREASCSSDESWTRRSEGSVHDGCARQAHGQNAWAERVWKPRRAGRK
jgi:hypothetical protein